MTKLTNSEAFALNQWLADYPENLSFYEVLKSIENESLDISLWYLIEDSHPKFIIQTICDTKTAFERATK